MYFKLNEKGIERYPDQGLTASTLLQDTGMMYRAPDAQNEIYKELVVMNEHTASLVFELDEYYPVTEAVLNQHGRFIKHQLDFKFDPAMPKHKAFSLELVPVLERDDVSWQFVIWSKPSTNLLDMEFAVNNALTEMKKELRIDESRCPMVPPILLVKERYLEKYNHAKAMHQNALADQ